MNLNKIEDTNITSVSHKSKRTRRDEKLKKSILDEIKRHNGDPKKIVSSTDKLIKNLVIFY